MIHTLCGNVSGRGERHFTLLCGPVGVTVFTNTRTVGALPKEGAVRVFTFLYVRDEQLELYGFLDEESLKLFSLLNSVSGVGPKTALGILDMDTVPNIIAAIIEKRAELLTRTSGIGKKTAERIILELQSKVQVAHAQALTKVMDLDREVEEALVGLGYPRGEVKTALSRIGGEAQTLEERLRLGLKSLGRTGK